MKYIKIITISILSAWLASSCNPLDVEPTDMVDAENAINNKKGLEAATNGVYDVLQGASYAQDVVLFGDLAGDNLIHIGTKKEYRQIAERSIVPENAYIAGIWNNSYDGINRVNNILMQIDDVTGVADATRDYYEGQSRFLRAYFYFTLANFYGDVPLRLEPVNSIAPEDLNMAATGKDEIMAFVIEELLAAANLMDGYTATVNAYASADAARALLARAYLYTQQWDKAATTALDVVQNNVPAYTETENSFTNSSFDGLFDESSAHPMVLLKVDFLNDESVNALADWCMPDARFEVSAWESTSEETSVANLYAGSDLRIPMTVTAKDPDNPNYYCNKYQDYETDKDNVLVLRMAEQYLIAAEALNEIAFVANGQAFDLLNQVRMRAGASTFSAGDAPGQELFRELVLQERRLEFAFEGHRYFDLRRTSQIDGALTPGGTLREANWYFPYPQSEVDLNEALEQRTGY